MDLNYRRSDNHETNGNGCDSAAPQDAGEILDPGGRPGDFYRGTSLNDTFGLKLIPERNPNASWGFNFSRECFSDRYDSGKVSDEIAARAAGRSMCADRLGKRRKPLVFQNRFDFLTLHGTSLRDEQPLGSSSHKTLY